MDGDGQQFLVFPQKAKNPQGLLGNRGIVGLLESILRLCRAKQ